MALMSPTMTLLSSGLTLAVYWIGTYLIDDVSQGEKLDIFSDKVVFFNYAIQVIMAFMLLNMIFILLPRAQVSAKRLVMRDGDIVESDNHKTLLAKGDFYTNLYNSQFEQIS